MNPLFLIIGAGFVLLGLKDTKSESKPLSESDKIKPLQDDENASIKKFDDAKIVPTVDKQENEIEIEASD